MGSQFDQADTRRSYDAVARRYAENIAGELANKPFDRAFLDGFANEVRERGPVVELGCGPGHVAGYLAGRGVDVSGLDLSPEMVAEARRLFPGLSVIVGDMLDLPFDDGSLAGVVSFYSIVHFTDDQLKQALAEMARVLRPGAPAALAFHIGDGILHRDEWWGEPVSVDFRYFEPTHVKELLAGVGLDGRSADEREPYAPEIEHQSRRAYIVAVRPSDEPSA